MVKIETNKKIKKILNSNDFKRILENVFSLGFLNIIRYAFPLLIVPYLLKTLGKDAYGKYAFSLSIIQSLVIIVKFGFDLFGTREIAKNLNNTQEVSKLFIHINFIRLLISFFLSIILILFAVLFDYLNGQELLYIYGVGILIGTAITPIWFFQGIEKMKFLTFINLIVKSVPTILIFIFINSQDDLQYLHLYNSMGYVIAGILSFMLSFRNYPIKIVPISLLTLKKLLRNSFHTFITSISINLYRNLNQIIIGIVVSYEAVAFYDAAEKIIKAIQNLINSISRALFPFFSRKLTYDSQSLFLKVGIVLIVFFIIISIFLILFSPLLLPFYYGAGFERAITNFQIQSSLIVFGGMNFYFGINGLLNLGKEKKLNIYLFITGVFSLLSCYILVSYFNDFGASITLILSEFLLTTLILSSYYKIFKK